MKSIVPKIGWVLLALAALVGFAIDWSHIAHGGEVDFRNRITGARLLAHGIDPYHYKWQPGDPTEYCDPRDHPSLPISRTTVTPALLLLHLPLAMMPYRLAQVFWLVLQWLLLMGTGWLWVRTGSTSRVRWLVALFVIAFSFTASWRLHAERGQCYVLLTFLFAYWLTSTLDPKRNNGFLTGCMAGFLVALRSPFLLLVPFLVLHRRGQLAGVATGLLLGFGLPMLMTPACWSDYFSAAQTFSYLYRHAIHVTDPAWSYPPIMEGLPTGIIDHLMLLPAGNFSIHAYLQRFNLEPFPAWPPLLVLAGAFAFWLWLSRGQPAARLLPGMAAWLFLADLFLPVQRESYNDALILDVVAAGLAVSPGIPWGLWPCLLALPIGAVVSIFNLDRPWRINLPTMLFTLSAVLFLFMFETRAEMPVRETTDG